MEAFELTLDSNASISGIDILFSDLSPAPFAISQPQEADMAKEIIERFSDDLDGSEATHTGVHFSFEGTEWSIDLNDGHYNELKAAVERFADHATKVSGSGRGRGRSASTASTGSSRSTKSELQAIRAWAEEHKIPLNARGRIKESVIAAYHENDPSLVGG
jgi:hypothetical protein